MNREKFSLNLRYAFRGKLALMVLIFFYACHSSKNYSRNILKFNLTTEPPSLDWSITTDSSSVQVLNNLMEGLCRYDKNLNPIPALAISWEVKEDGRKYIFHLRKNAYWSDGRPVKAQDFVYSWQRLVNPETASEYAYFLYLVKNARKINAGKIKDLSRLGIRAIDNFTLEVELERPAVYFPLITTFVSTFPLRQDLIKKYPDSWTEPEHLVTTGPFVLKSWRHEYKLELEPNPYYYGEKPRLKKIIFYMVNEPTTALTLYETGDLDLVRPPPSAIPSYQDSPEYYRGPFLATYYLGFNVQKSPLNDPRVRKALAMAIDRSQIPKILQGGQIPAKSFIPPGMFGHNPKIGYDFNPKQAGELLKQAGYESGKKLPPITLMFNIQQEHQLICEYVQAQWQAHLGITVYLKNMEWKVFLKELDLDPPQVFRLGWVADYPDPDNFARVFTSQSGNNHTNWKNLVYDQLVELGVQETDPEKRRAIYNRLQRILLEEECVIVPLYFYVQNWLVKPYVQGLEFNPLGILYFQSVWLEKNK